MAFFLTTEDNEIFEMDATVEVGFSQTGKPTSYAVEEGFKVSDHYIQDPDTVSFKGVVSEVKFLRRAGEGLPTKSLTDFEVGITELKKSGKFFTCTFSKNLTPLQNCLFTTLKMDRLSETAIDINFSIQQIRVASRAANVKGVIPAQEYEGKVEGTSNGVGSTKKVERETPLGDRMRESFAIGTS